MSVLKMTIRDAKVHFIVEEEGWNWKNKTPRRFRHFQFQKRSLLFFRL